MGFSRG